MADVLGFTPSLTETWHFTVTRTHIYIPGMDLLSVVVLSVLLFLSLMNALDTAMASLIIVPLTRRHAF